MFRSLGTSCFAINVSIYGASAQVTGRVSARALDHPGIKHFRYIHAYVYLIFPPDRQHTYMSHMLVNIPARFRLYAWVCTVMASKIYVNRRPFNASFVRDVLHTTTIITIKIYNTSFVIFFGFFFLRRRLPPQTGINIIKYMHALVG